MRDESAITQMGEIAASTVSIEERAQGLLELLDHWLPVDATWMALSDPASNDYTTVGSTGLAPGVLDYLDRPSVAQEIRDAGINVRRPPVSLAELPFAADELPTWAECLTPAGFREGLGVPLFEAGGPYLGMLTLLFGSRDTPSDKLRDRLMRLSPMIARGVSPMRSLAATARLVRGASAGAVLYRDGPTCPLPGLDDHAILVPESPVVAIAREALLAGQLYKSFVWPAEADAGANRHLRVTVLAATDASPVVLGTLLVGPGDKCRGLTPRELQVLGLLMDGRSNQQIATQLAVAARTVAAHVEHILYKLETPTRTMAAVRAEREGCYVPPQAPNNVPQTI
ncbi:helix-turn-helix transcriptional regulator [Nocardioides zeicaulis]|uniref:Response regulator transcription factor n=1 Tax=Nocardioides zeicaulis TaxID=1776857 RepID=A0ABV6E248_9ACTN